MCVCSIKLHLIKAAVFCQFYTQQVKLRTEIDKGSTHNPKIKSNEASIADISYLSLSLLTPMLGGLVGEGGGSGGNGDADSNLPLSAYTDGSF